MVQFRKTPARKLAHGSMLAYRGSHIRLCVSPPSRSEQFLRPALLNFDTVMNEKAQVLATNVGHFDSIIMIDSHPICIKICHEDKCNLNRPEGQCKPDQYSKNQLTRDSKLPGQRNQKNDKNGRNQRNKRDIFLEYSSHDPITDLLDQVRNVLSYRPPSFSDRSLSGSLAT